MSFTFGFAGDDIEGDDDQDQLVQQLENSTIDDAPLVPPKKHTLRSLLNSLPSQVSCNLLPIHNYGQSGGIDQGIAYIPRRSVFDIRAQLMAEANPDENENDSLLAGLERGDLTSGIYEGGFKTWECSLDLASLVAGLSFDRPLHIIELGAGSAIPSLVAIATMLRKQPPKHPVHFTLCDYNEDVLRLATAPNIFLASNFNTQGNELAAADGEELDIEDIDSEVAESCLQRFEAANISFDFVSGAWGEDFIKIVESSESISSGEDTSVLILASETIYSPKSTRTFVDTLLRLLRRDPTRSRAWVAAKKVYFGVGGGVDDFVEQVRKRGGIVEALLDGKDTGVGRVILEVCSGE